MDAETAVAVAIHRFVRSDDAAQQLRNAAKLKSEIDWAERDAVVRLRESGASWQRIADALGVTKQATHERFSYLT